VLYTKRKNTEIQKFLFPLFYMILYKTKWGLKKMDAFAKKVPKKLIKILDYTSIIAGFLGMLAIIPLLFLTIYHSIRIGGQTFTAVLPGITVNGVTLSFLHWIITLFVIVIVHEFSHGFFARLHKIKVKSSGFAVLGILLPLLPAAFVEPDEKSLNKATKKNQLAVFSAGPFSNLVLTFLLLFLILSPLTVLTTNSKLSDPVLVNGFEQGYPSTLESELNIGDTILSVNEIDTLTILEFKKELNKYQPYEKITIQTEESKIPITLGANPSLEGIQLKIDSLNEKINNNIELIESKVWYSSILNIENNYFNKLIITSENELNYYQDKGYLGINLESSTKSQIFSWFHLLIFWIVQLSLAIGLINLLPVVITDGGMMLTVGLSMIIKNKKVAERLSKTINMFFLMILVPLILYALFQYLRLPFIR